MSELPPGNPLLLAAQTRNVELMRSLLAHAISPAPSLNDKTPAGNSALGFMLMIRSADSSPVLLSLLERGANPDSVEPDLNASTDRNPATGRYEHPKAHLAEMAASLNPERGELIFQALGEARLKELSSQFPLLLRAVSSNSVWAARALLRAGANPNFDFPGQGLAASKISSLEMLAVLVSAGARLNIADANGLSPLQSLASSRCDPALLQLAVSASEAESVGAKANLSENAPKPKLKRGQPAASALIDGLFRAIEEKQKKNVAALWSTIGRKRALSALDSSGRNVLHPAVLARNWPLARRLLSAGVDPNVFDQSGQSALSIFIGLARSDQEKDRSGDKRLAMASEFLAAAKWDALGPSGAGYAVALWPLCFASANGLYPSKVSFLWESDQLSPGARDAQGLSFIDRVLPVWLEKKGSFDYNSPAREIGSFGALVTRALDSGSVDDALRDSLLNAFVGPLSAPLWEQSAYFTRSLAAEIEPITLRLIALGNPDALSLRVAPTLSAAAPSLYAALEAWQLNAQARAAPSTPEAARRSRSL